ncbi:3-hydroxyisobutyryl-CoA hydrolase [Falsochrobactrum shanghaiense]|uniref:3-hydroxyisobutyryl-CoA hydrolase n=1 Tax=Falsochrobactrum shanghaiense TaxID=2201899 RepID=A0A316JFW3_9HYPH|nr:enoyl-CoA hydratase/isomerase family protein [Falsochrobactrum shanghaiense]PWL18103.1 3-hydroxyisobutyryl-CoA hydrolase [Falsochrobactrum shanghaiense]
MQIDFGGGSEISFERKGRAGLVRLTRASALNALTHNMILALHRALDAWEADPAVACVIVEGEGRAFCAGGDVVAAYKAGREGAPNYDFFRDEYRINARIGRFSKPYISLLDGIVMGGGAGISVHGSHRIVTENTLFAMPETAIGFFPDVGGSAFLPHLHDNFGYYLALTGNRIRWGDCLQSGIATHAVAVSDLEDVREDLIAAANFDALAARSQYPDFETAPQARQVIAECFAHATLDECLATLRGLADKGSKPATDILTVLATRSPTSLAVTFRQIAQGGSLDLDDCMRMEYRIASRMIEGHDFYEGIRAVLIDKDGAPVWQPSSPDAVTAEAVDAYFANMGERELSF